VVGGVSETHVIILLDKKERKYCYSLSFLLFRILSGFTG